MENPEACPSIGKIRVKHRGGRLLTLKGTVTRTGSIKMIEGSNVANANSGLRLCLNLKLGILFGFHHFVSLREKSCEGTSFQFVEDSIVCHDYQEIKIQESTQVLGVGSIPRSIPVVLKDDLVDIVKAGDDVIVTGVLTEKWSSDMKDVRCDLDPLFVANYVRRTNELKANIDVPDDIVQMFEQFWIDFKDTPLRGRNAILQGICPQIFGLFTVKLAVALTLIGGVQHVDACGTKVRGDSHLLLVGDPGTGKSQFMKFAAKLSNRSVMTTGLGSTSAGLTVTAVRDGGRFLLTYWSFIIIL
ncbi:hypothetical protein MKX01_009181 [Papaver californicum]|nr:hypothetical protein MKX01_009181 [Papaver californicum]